MNARTTALWILTAILTAIPAAGFGQNAGSAVPEEPWPIPRITSPVTLDGLSDEEAWTAVKPLPLTQIIPNYGKPPTEKTEILIGHDDNFIYVAGRLYDREPDKIQSPSKKRDFFESNTEWLGILFDTFNDKENALGFFTTPSGLRWDGMVTNDAEQRTINEMPINASWNTFWDVAVVQNDRGWFAEMRIPFSSLRFQEKDGRVVMGMKAFRWIPRKAENDCFPAVDLKLGTMALWKPSLCREIILEGVVGRRPLYITPYGLGGYGQYYDLNAEETEYVHKNKPTTEAGLDIKYSLTSNLTLDLTANTDFAQVEADDYQVNLTRFSLFFPEKRLFFLERAGIFDFSFGEYNQLFYSRRIGIYEEEPVRIYG
ncbi:MAG: carbohydrate binding family 9 domain-containing protein, partial [Candidatus Aminicenantes bacterium]|nr:carbohydrate binding family 9 domain-containing protein [Candidatus Aminicenantes bacterium]